MSLHQSDDLLLLTQYCKHGNQKAFGVLYQRHFTMVLGVCLRYVNDNALAEDYTQQVFERLLSIVCKHEITYFKTWLYQTTKNHCLMQLRKNNPVDYNSDHIAISNQGADHTDGITEKGSQEAQFQQLEQAIANLNPEQQLVIKKFFLEKKSYAVIESETGWDFKKIKSLIQNAKRNLKNALS